jgi:hypothetical protein
MLHPEIGDVIQIKASKFLGTPATVARVQSIFTMVTQKVWVVREFDLDLAATNQHGCYGDPFEVDSDGVVLIGPPLHGQLVRAP